MTSRILLALPADLHCGSAFGLMPPAFVTADGQVIQQNQVQEITWDHWISVAKRIGDERREGDRLVIIHMGDGTEGVHHGIVDIVSAREDEHARLNVACMDEFMKHTKFDTITDTLYYVVGTATHVKIGAFLEEVAAERLGGVPCGERYTWPKIEATIGRKHMIFAHHGAGTNSRVWLRGNLIHDAMKHMYWSRLELDQAIPDYVVVAHKHVPNKRTFEGQRKNVTGIVLPSMKGMDEYTNRITVESILNVGVGWMVIDGDEVAYNCDTIVVEQNRVVRL